MRNETGVAWAFPNIPGHTRAATVTMTVDEFKAEMEAVRQADQETVADHWRRLWGQPDMPTADVLRILSTTHTG